jgi:hypothetical protein
MDTLSFKKTVQVSALPPPSSDLNGVLVRLNSDNKPYWCNGTQWIDITAVGGGGGSLSSTLRNVSFGEVPTYSKQFFIEDPAANPGDRYFVHSFPEDDEAEMDGIVYSAHCTSPTLITVYAHAIPGPVSGAKKVIYVKV